jgi:hypothetical protein
MEKSRQKPEKGQKLYIVGWNYTKMQGVCTVISSGPKFFEVHIDGQSDYYKTKFHQERWNEKTECSGNYVIYSSKEEYLEEQEETSIRSFIREFISYGKFNSLGIEHLKKIEEILLSVSTVSGETK